MDTDKSYIMVGFIGVEQEFSLPAAVRNKFYSSGIKTPEQFISGGVHSHIKMPPAVTYQTVQVSDRIILPEKS